MCTASVRKASPPRRPSFCPAGGEPPARFREVLINEDVIDKAAPPIVMYAKEAAEGGLR